LPVTTIKKIDRVGDQSYNPYNGRETWHKNRQFLTERSLNPSSASNPVTQVLSKVFRPQERFDLWVDPEPEGKKLVVLGEKAAVLADPFRGNTFNDASTLKICDLTLENTQCLMDLFPFTKPVLS